MFLKKYSALIASIAIALLMLTVSAGNGFAEVITDSSADFNGQGVMIPAGYDDDLVEVTKMDPDGFSDSPFRFVSPLLEIQFLSDGIKVDSPKRLTYVYFNMNHIERRAWDSGRAGIYFQDQAGRWVNCGTVNINVANTPNGRLACVVPGSATFGLGIREIPNDLQPGAQVSAGVENASFLSDNIAQTGNQGIYAASGLDPNRIIVRLVEPGSEFLPDAPFDARRPILWIDWIGDELPQIPILGQDPTVIEGFGLEPTALTNLTYVFYTLDNISRQQWDDGSLALYYYDQVGRSWEVCSTADLALTGDYGTVSCLATQFTYYALGRTNPTGAEK